MIKEIITSIDKHNNLVKGAESTYYTSLFFILKTFFCPNLPRNLRICQLDCNGPAAETPGRNLQNCKIAGP